MNNVNQTAKLICHAYLNLIARRFSNNSCLSTLENSGEDNIFSSIIFIMVSSLIFSRAIKLR